MFRVLVTACRGPAGASVMALLDAAIFKGGLSDVEVIGVDAASGEVPLATSPDYLDKVMALAAGCDLIIPGCDEETVVLAADPRSASRPRGSVLLTRDKAELYSHLRYAMHRSGGDVPTYIVGAYVKLLAGRGGAGSYRLGENWLACEYLPGVEFSVDLVRWGGVLRGAVARVREHVVRGVSLSGTVIHGSQVERLAERVANALAYQGAMNVQLKFRGDGVPVLTDVNARFGGGITIAAAAGANLPELLVRCARGEDAFAPRPTPGRYASSVDRRPE